MDFREYQKKSRETAMYPDAGNNIMYPTLELAGEAGEVANKVKKIFRDGGEHAVDEMRDKIEDELGDLLWYAAQLATEMDLELDVVAEKNITKILKRKADGTLHSLTSRT